MVGTRVLCETILKGNKLNANVLFLQRDCELTDPVRLGSVHNPSDSSVQSRDVSGESLGVPGLQDRIRGVASDDDDVRDEVYSSPFDRNNNRVSVDDAFESVDRHGAIKLVEKSDILSCVCVEPVGMILDRVDPEIVELVCKSCLLSACGTMQHIHSRGLLTA